MKKVRITANELISELRQNNISDIKEVQYAILEQNGKISVIQKPEYRQPSAKDLNISIKDTGLYHVVIENGYINRHGAEELDLDKEKKSKILDSKKIRRKDVFLMMVSDSGEIEIIRKDKK